MLPNTDESALHNNGQSSDAWYWEPTHIGQVLVLASLAVTFIVQFVPEDVRRDISREVWGYIKDGLHRVGQWVSGHPRQQQNAAWVGLNVQGYDSDGNGSVDSYGDWDEADYDDDGRTDYTSPQANATTAHDVSLELETQLYYVDGYLRRQGR